VAAITYWVDPVGGNDGNDGKSYANRIQTMTQLKTDLDLESDGNDFTINCLNTGDYVCATSSNSVYVNGKNTSTFVFRGVSDSSATPGFATVKPGDAANSWFFYLRGATSAIWEYFDVDGTTSVSVTSSCHFASFGNNTNGMRVQYCKFRGGVASTQTKSNVNVYPVENVPGTGTGITDWWQIKYCYFENSSASALIPSNTLSDTTKIHDNVIIVDFEVSSSWKVWGVIGGAAGWSFSFYNNTCYLNYGTTVTTSSVSCTEFSDNLNCDFYNNVFFYESQHNGTVSALVAGAGGSPTSSFTPITAIGYNVFLDSAASHASYVSPAYSGANPWDPDITGPPLLYTGDVFVEDAVEASYFNDSSSTYDWTPTDSALVLTVPYDLRLLQESSSGLAGSTPGALPPASTTYTVTCTARKNYFKEDQPVGFDITVTNTGTDADSVVLTTNPMPADLNYISAKASQGSFSYHTVNKIGSWAIGTLTSGQTVTLQVGYIAPFGVEDVQTMTATWTSASIGASGSSVLVATATATPLSSTGGGGGGDGGDPADNPATVPFIDTMPLQGDIHQMDINLRLSTTRNREREQYVRSDIEGQRWAEARVLRVNVATNTATAINMGGIEQGHYLLVESDEPVLVSVNGTATADYMPQAKAVVLIDTEIEELAVKNASTSTSANVLIAVVD
jgi:uncharacterized repeat protein (TIGR01451 family)